MVQASKRVAIYARVSTDDQDCGRQLKDLREFAQSRGDVIVAEKAEKASGAKNDRKERKAIIELARSRKIDAVVVTELTRWGRSTQDLIETLRQLEAWGVSVISQTGLDFDMTTPQGKLFSTIMAGLAEFERDLIRERVRSGLSNARAKGKTLGRQIGECPSNNIADKVMVLIREGRSYRWISHELQISKTTVVNIVKRQIQMASA